MNHDRQAEKVHTSAGGGVSGGRLRRGRDVKSGGKERKGSGRWRTQIRSPKKKLVNLNKRARGFFGKKGKEGGQSPWNKSLREKVLRGDVKAIGDGHRINRKDFIHPRAYRQSRG